MRVKSTYTACMDRTLLVLYRLARTPALQASASAILLASIPSVKDLFVLKSSDTTKVPPLYFVYDAVSTLGSAQVPVSMIMLSGTATIRYMNSLRRKAITMTVKDQEDRIKLGLQKLEAPKPQCPPLKWNEVLSPISGKGDDDPTHATCPTCT